jgi:hypothetical protein
VGLEGSRGSYHKTGLDPQEDHLCGEGKVTDTGFGREEAARYRMSLQRTLTQRTLRVPHLRVCGLGFAARIPTLNASLQEILVRRVSCGTTATGGPDD